MTAKEKAEEVYNKFSALAVFTKHTAINYSIIHVKGIIEEIESISVSHAINLYDDRNYWQQVLTELNQM